MTATPAILVLCTANVCRSVYAAHLLRSLLDPQLVTVQSAGLEVTRRLPACPLVAERASLGAPRPEHRSHHVSVEEIRSSALILTMTAAHRGEVARLVPAARRVTFTLIEAATIAPAISHCSSLAGLAGEMDDSRSRVPMPPGPRPLLPWVQTSGSPAAVDIADGHLARRESEHVRTLNQIERLAEVLADPVRMAVSSGTSPNERWRNP